MRGGAMGEEWSFKKWYVLLSGAHCSYTRHCNANTIIQYKQAINMYSLNTNNIIEVSVPSHTTKTSVMPSNKQEPRKLNWGDSKNAIFRQLVLLALSRNLP
jgi:hypothetical protein